MTSLWQLSCTSSCFSLNIQLIYPERKLIFLNERIFIFTMQTLKMHQISRINQQENYYTKVKLLKITSMTSETNYYIPLGLESRNKVHSINYHSSQGNDIEREFSNISVECFCLRRYLHPTLEYPLKYMGTTFMFELSKSCPSCDFILMFSHISGIVFTSLPSQKHTHNRKHSFTVFLQVGNKKIRKLDFLMYKVLHWLSLSFYWQSHLIKQHHHPCSNCHEPKAFYFSSFSYTYYQQQALSCKPPILTCQYFLSAGMVCLGSSLPFHAEYLLTLSRATEQQLCSSFSLQYKEHHQQCPHSFA